MLRVPRRTLSVTYRQKNEYISMSRVPAKPMRKKSPSSPIPAFKYEVERQIFKDAARHKAVLQHRYRQNDTKYFNSDELAQKQWDHDTNFTHYDRNITLDHRLTAAVDNECAQMDRIHFAQNLQKAGSALNIEMLTNLALHEPQTFSCLVEVAHRFEHEVIWERNGVELPPNCLSKVPDYS